MLLKEFCTTDALFCPRETTVLEAARIMRQKHVGDIVVVDDPNDECIPVGLVTDRDIVVRAVAENRLPSNAAVSTVMSEGVYTCFDDSSIDDAARIMAEHQVRRLPVLDRDGRLVGIISIGDIARSGAKEAEELALEGVSQPSDRPRR